MIDQSHLLKKYKKEGNEIKQSTILFSLLISAKNTPPQDLYTTYQEYKKTLHEENNEVEKYIEWLAKQWEHYIIK